MAQTLVLQDPADAVDLLLFLRNSGFRTERADAASIRVLDGDELRLRDALLLWERMRDASVELIE